MSRLREKSTSDLYYSGSVKFHVAGPDRHTMVFTFWPDQTVKQQQKHPLYLSVRMRSQTGRCRQRTVNELGELCFHASSDLMRANLSVLQI